MFRLGFGECAFELVGDGGEVDRVGRCGRLWRELLGERGVMFAERLKARLEGGHARLEAFRVEGACFERGVVAVDGSLDAADLVAHCTSSLFDRRLVGLLPSRGLCERLADERALAVERGELLEHRSLELVTRDAFAVAALSAELLPAGASVVVIAAAVAAGAHANVGAPAAAAAKKPREQVVPWVGATQRPVVAPLAQQTLRPLERELIDERLVQPRQALPAPDHAAEIGLILEHPLHHRRLPAGPRRRRLLARESPCDRGGTEPAAGVQLEDPPDRWRRPLVGDERLFLVALIAEWDPTARPAALFRAALDAGGDAVDNRRVLEFGEHGQHLQLIGRQHLLVIETHRDLAIALGQVSR